MSKELPPGCRGLKLVALLNGETVQSTMIDIMVLDVATQIAIGSEAITLNPGDVFATGTPSGVRAGTEAAVVVEGRCCLRI